MALCLLAGTGFAADEVQFTDSEIRAILAHGPWPAPLASDPTNRASGRRAAVELGERLFFDTRLSAERELLLRHLPRSRAQLDR